MSIHRILCGQYHFKPLILKLKENKKTNQEIADLLDISTSTVKYIIRNGITDNIDNKITELIGYNEKEFLREAAVYSCMELFSNKGWQVGISDSKCVFDVFCLKDNKSVKIQVKSSKIFSARNYPLFKTARMLYNTKRSLRKNYVKGDFDFWYFYSINKDEWLIPFESVTNKALVSMEGFDNYKIL